MKIIHGIVKMSQEAMNVKRKGRRIGFVPTMGALHEGHMSLIQRARKECDIVVVSIFVNPLQFGKDEDFKKYPRTISRDALACRKEGVDFIFNPAYTAMYPEGYDTYVYVDRLSKVLCALSRPGHFKGVATVVAKLFNIVEPDIAYFGQKDAQQALIIRKMAKDLNMPVKITVLPTKREVDGLAMSSRNAYLNEKERADAVVLSQALRLARRMSSRGEKKASTLIAAMRRHIAAAPTLRIEYAAVVDPSTLRPVKRITGKSLAALAVRIGNTRLIDNAYVT